MCVLCYYHFLNIILQHSQLDNGELSASRPNLHNSSEHQSSSNEGRSNPLFSRNISLPGHSLVAQQLALPGNDPARLINVRRRTDSGGGERDTVGESAPMSFVPPTPAVSAEDVTAVAVSPQLPQSPALAGQGVSSLYELEQLHAHQLQHWWERYLQQLHCIQQGERGPFQSPQPGGSGAEASTGAPSRPPRPRHRSPRGVPPLPPHHPLSSASEIADGPHRAQRARRRRRQRHRQLRALARQGNLSAYEALHHQPSSSSSSSSCQHHHHQHHRQQHPHHPHHHHSPRPEAAATSPPPPPPPPTHLPFDRNFYPLTFLQFMSGVTSMVPVHGVGNSGEPPPPYVTLLPPYLEFDPAPAYRSRETSSLGSREEGDNTGDNTATTSAES